MDVKLSRSPEHTDDHESINDPDYDSRGASEDQLKLQDPDVLDDAEQKESGTSNHKRPTKRSRLSKFRTRTEKVVRKHPLRSTAVETASLIIHEGQLPATSSPSKAKSFSARWERRKDSKKSLAMKQMTHELNSDDELMLKLRGQGYTDRLIAQKLTDLGRAKYDPKSIATRITRLRERQCERVDYLLQEGHIEWQLEDDQALIQAYDLADIEIRCEMERLRAWRFRKVSEHMRRLRSDAMFGAQACQNRYAALTNGSAVIPSDVDDDPVARRQALEAFRTRREANRSAEVKHKSEKEADDRQAKEEAIAQRAQKAAEAAARRESTLKEKADRAMLRATKAMQKAQAAQDDSKQTNERLASMAAKETDESPKQPRKQQKSANTPSPYSWVTADTPDPRDQLSMTDVQKLCKENKLSASKGTRTQLVQRLRDAHKRHTVEVLKSLLSEKGIMFAQGNRVQLRYQLALLEAKTCDSYTEEDPKKEGDREMSNEDEDNELTAMQDDEI